MQQLSTILSQVPVWVWFALAYGLWAGVRAMRVRKVSLALATLVPVLFLALSLSGLIAVVGTAPAVGLAWLLAGGAGAALGWYFLSSEPLEVHRGRGTLVVGGTWTFLVLFLVVFAAKYAYGYAVATGSAWATQTWFQVTVFGVSGLSTGIVTGRTGRLYTEYFRTPLAEKV